MNKRNWPTNHTKDRLYRAVDLTVCLLVVVIFVCYMVKMHRAFEPSGPPAAGEGSPLTRP